MTSKKTSILNRDGEPPAPAPKADDAVALGIERPWRIALVIPRYRVELIINLTGELMVGRVDPRHAIQPDIDLRPFGAEEQGVSRQHLFFRLEGDSVVVVDNKSSNGTWLNGTQLEPNRAYPLHHRDSLVLGGLETQVEMLINPLD